MTKKLDIEEMRKIAESRGGECISDMYIDAKTKLRWRCTEGHVWNATPNNIKRGKWCPFCAHSIPLTIEEMRKIAESRGGLCLSDACVNTHTNLRWRCKYGHEWSATPTNVKRGTWCPFCAGVVKITIEEMQKIATSKGGACLSEVCTNGKTKLHWRCKEGHEWDATPNNIKRGKWCPRCARIALENKIRLDINEMREMAKSREGECLSEIYTNAHTNLLWRCKYGHKWYATPNMIQSGHWCHRCGGNVRLTIEEMQKLAASKGGVCLSEKYVNSITKLHWCCKKGHEWRAVPSSVKLGSWCQICSSKVTERICRGLFEYIFDTPFPPKRPNWLINDTGHKLELDGYCEKLGIAFEYQGKQHTEEIPFFHQNRTLSAQMKTDGLKKELCNRHNVKLILVPHSIKNENKFEYIVSECKKQGIQPPNKEKIDYTRLDVYSPQWIEELRALAISKGGACISEKYVDAHTNLLWRCKEGHVWNANPSNIKSEKWCPVCSDERNASKRRSTIDEMKELAKSRGGDCLSNVYKNSQAKLRWRCKEGHEWAAIPSNIKSGHWCPYCVNRALLTIDEMKAIAKSRGGQCLSGNYVNEKTKLLWSCKEGHEWEALPRNIKTGNWCPFCGGSMKLTIEKMNDLAMSKGGACISEKYVNARTNLQWRCKKGHIWDAKPYNVNSGHWCPICARIKRKKIKNNA